MEKFKFGQLVKFLRLQKKLTIKDLLLKMGNPFNATYMTKIELKNEIPSPINIIKLANALDQKYDLFIETAKKEQLQNYKKKIDRIYKVK